MKDQASHVMPFGAQWTEAQTRFRLWAPAAEKITLALLDHAGERGLAMHTVGDGWFEQTVQGVRTGAHYRFQLADGSYVPDPASRFQPNDVDGPSEVVDPNAYAWQVPDWKGRPWHQAILQEVHIGCFGGDCDGVRAHLDHLERLGVTAIELMPVASFAGRRGWGYDGVLPFAPDASYGRPEDLKRLVDACHARGLMILLDVVYNHFGPSGNYLGRYAPQFFTDRVHTPWGEAIDFSRRPVRDFFLHNALYWLREYRFDGLRFDAVDQIRDNSDPHILTEIADTVRARIPDRHVHLVLENDDNVARYLERENGRPRFYTAQWNDDFHHVAHLLATGERDGYYVDYTDAPVARLARALAEGFVYQGEYSTYRERLRGTSSAQLPPLAFVDFLQNHDQIGNRAFGKRIGQLAGEDSRRTLYALLLLAPSVPLLFMGEEWAASTPFLFFCDFDEDLNQAVREGRRQEFARFEAFRDPQPRQRIPDPTVPETFERSCLDWTEPAQPPHAQWLAFIQQLIALRQRELVPRLAGMDRGHVDMYSESAFAVTWPLATGGHWRMAANLGRTPVAIPPLAGKRLYAGCGHDAQGLAPGAVRVHCDDA